MKIENANWGEGGRNTSSRGGDKGPLYTSTRDYLDGVPGVLFPKNSSTTLLYYAHYLTRHKSENQESIATLYASKFAFGFRNGKSGGGFITI